MQKPNPQTTPALLQKKKCLSKTTYNSREDAAITLGWLNHKQFIYQCGICNKYHFTKRKPK